MSTGRIALVAFLAVITLGLVYRTFIETSSHEATVASVFIRLSAPIAGYVRHDLHAPGALLKGGAQVAELHNPLIDHTHVDELRARRDTLTGDVTSLETMLASLSGLATSFQRRGHEYDRYRSQQLNTLIAQAEARAEVEQARLREAKSRSDRIGSLVDSGVTSQQDRDQSMRDFEVAKSTASAAVEEVANLRTTLASFDKGIGIGDYSASDRPYSGQRADDIKLRIAQLEGELRERRAQREAVLAELDAQEKQLARQENARVSALVRARVWSIDAADGEFVAANRTIARLVDCTKFYVFAQLNERNFARLHVGDAARIEIKNLRQTFKGRVALMMGSPLADGEQVGAGVLLNPTKASTFSVVVESSEMADALSTSCEVGQPAKVIFEHTGLL